MICITFKIYIAFKNIRLRCVLNTLWLLAVNYDHTVVPQDFDRYSIRKIMIIIVVKNSETIEIVGTL